MKSDAGGAQFVRGSFLFLQDIIVVLVALCYYLVFRRACDLLID